MDVIDTMYIICDECQGSLSYQFIDIKINHNIDC